MHFTDYEFEKIDINEICRQAGVTKGAFYHHFATKQQLLLELLDNWINSIALQMEPSDFTNSDPVSIINTIIEKLQPVFEQAGRQLPVFLHLYLNAVNDSQLRVYVLKSYNNFVSFFSGIIKNGRKKGFIKKNIDPENVSRILFSITLGLLIQGLIDPEGANWGQLAKDSIALLLN